MSLSVEEVEKVWRNPSNQRQLQQLAYKEWARIPADKYRRLTEWVYWFAAILFITSSISTYFRKGSNNCVHLFLPAQDLII